MSDFVLGTIWGLLIGNGVWVGFWLAHCRAEHRRASAAKREEG